MRQIPVNGRAADHGLVLVIGGVIMVMLGIIGEYVWAAFTNEVRGKPNYVVRRIE